MRPKRSSQASGQPFSWWIKLQAGRRLGHVNSRLELAYVHRFNRRYKFVTALMLVAAALSALRWEAGLALAGAVTLFYLFAPPTPVYRWAAPVVKGE